MWKPLSYGSSLLTTAPKGGCSNTVPNCVGSSIFFASNARSVFTPRPERHVFGVALCATAKKGRVRRPSALRPRSRAEARGEPEPHGSRSPSLPQQVGEVPAASAPTCAGPDVYPACVNPNRCEEARLLNFEQRAGACAWLHGGNVDTMGRSRRRKFAATPGASETLPRRP